MNAAALARYEAGLSVAEAAERAKIHDRTIRRIESGEIVRPSAPIAKALAEVYGVTVAELLGIHSGEAA